MIRQEAREQSDIFSASNAGLSSGNLMRGAILTLSFQSNKCFKYIVKVITTVLSCTWDF